MKNNLASIIALSMASTHHANYLMNDRFFHSEGQPTINGGRAKFKQNKRKQTKRKNK